MSDAKKGYFPDVWPAIINGVSLIGFGVMTLFLWSLLTSHIVSVLEKTMPSEIMEGLRPIAVQMFGIQSIKLLNSSNIYLFALIGALVAIITIVDSALEVFVENVADRLGISVLLLREVNGDGYEVAIKNSGCVYVKRSI
eukprot:Tbor_TRINITY_DN4759_c0_g2::TRINITY_DN4759_c0_g2_i1::g.17106::m.17106